MRNLFERFDLKKKKNYKRFCICVIDSEKGKLIMI